MRTEAHSHYPSKKAAPLYLPDFSARSVTDIDFKQLKKLGVKHVMFDLDLTLRRAYSRHLETEIIDYLVNLRKTSGFKSINLVTNNIRKLKRYAEPLGVRIFQPYREGWRIRRKPQRKFFERVLKELGAKPADCVMIGDKLFADVVGGNRMGMYTVLVTPRGMDYWFDLLLLTRFREKRSLNAARSRLLKLKDLRRKRRR